MKARADDMMDCSKSESGGGGLLLAFPFFCFVELDERIPLLPLCDEGRSLLFLWERVETGFARALASSDAECEYVERVRRGRGEK